MFPELPPIGDPLLSPEIFDPGVIPPALAFPFSKFIRKLIGNRDNWECQDDGCGKSFWDNWMVHASHYNHTKGESYDTPDQGRIQCVDHHQAWHELFRGHSEDIGLTESQNDWAISQLEKTDRRRREH